MMDLIAKSFIPTINQGAAQAKGGEESVKASAEATITDAAANTGSPSKTAQESAETQSTDFELKKDTLKQVLEILVGELKAA